MSPGGPDHAQGTERPAAGARADLPVRPAGAGTDVTGGDPGSDRPPPTSFFDAVGGAATFRELGRRFYEGVRADPVLRPLYPEDHLDAAEERLVLFLMQYWGGPDTYSAQRGHPRLRMRHQPFAIGPAERDAWLANMRQALDALGLDERNDAVLWEYLVRAAFSLQNRH